MTTPLRIAKIANARNRIAELLAGRCTSPESLAREVIDELLRLGWVYPGWHLDEPTTQPSSSTPEGRRRARELFAAARRASRADDTDTTGRA